MRTCISCNKEKPVTEYRRTTAKECKNCMHKRKWLKRTYGITQQEYDGMMLDQAGKCDICKCDLKEGRTTHVDHDHNTGKIRGLLCRNCNFAIGLLNDSLDSLKNAIAYLIKHSV
jgi:hypothetical protein